MNNAWEKDYVNLDVDDFKLPLTSEKRVRVAAAVATMCRDTAMFEGRKNLGANAETIRAILVMSETEWERDVIGSDLEKTVRAFDPVSPRKRYDQTVYDQTVNARRL